MLVSSKWCRGSPLCRASTSSIRECVGTVFAGRGMLRLLIRARFRGEASRYMSDAAGGSGLMVRREVVLLFGPLYMD